MQDLEGAPGLGSRPLTLWNSPAIPQPTRTRCRRSRRIYPASYRLSRSRPSRKTLMKTSAKTLAKALAKTSAKTLANPQAKVLAKAQAAQKRRTFDLELDELDASVADTDASDDMTAEPLEFESS
jgi:hypothetical protein